MQEKIDLKLCERILSSTDTIQICGRVTRVVGTVIEGVCPDATIGRLCHIYPSQDSTPIKAEIVGFKDDTVLMMPFGDMRGLRPGSKIVSIKHRPTIRVGNGLLGRVLDSFGDPIDGGGTVPFEMEYPIYAEPINPFNRNRITEPMDLGIRSINGLLTCGVGQRVGIMSGSGVGKSVLLGMIARNTSADINVIALVGERGRELKEFIERDLGEEGLKRSVVLAVTSEMSPLFRVRAPFAATAIAEYFRDQGMDVLLMMDSVTRVAMAQREIGLAVGEPPTTKGYTPSVFALLPKLLERTGMHDGPGSITGLYTVLVEGDDMNEPVADSVRATLDGHIVLSRKLAERNHYPAIDILESKSRLMIDIVDDKHRELAGRIVELIAVYNDAETLINIGAYVSGSNPKIDQAIRMKDGIDRFLQQDLNEKVDFARSVSHLESLFAE